MEVWQVWQVQFELWSHCDSTLMWWIHSHWYQQTTKLAAYAAVFKGSQGFSAEEN